MGETKPTRGRFQVQGADMRPELSSPWSQATPLRKANAHARLTKLEEACSKSQHERRLIAFSKAHRLVDSGPADAPLARSYPGTGPDDARVDVELKVGRAFV